MAANPDWADCSSCGCVDGQASVDRWEIKGVIKTRTCPRRLITDESRAWIDLFRHYRAGHLCFAGGVADQPVVYLDAMQIIEQEVSSGGPQG